jgi:hypothetical protein
MRVQHEAMVCVGLHTVMQVTQGTTEHCPPLLLLLLLLLLLQLLLLLLQMAPLRMWS